MDPLDAHARRRLEIFGPLRDMLRSVEESLTMPTTPCDHHYHEHPTLETETRSAFGFMAVCCRCGLVARMENPIFSCNMSSPGVVGKITRTWPDGFSRGSPGVPHA